MGQARAILADAPPRPLAEEVPVALVYDATTQAVMMATPADLEDFAVGFTVTEGIAAPGDILDLEIVDHGAGREARMWLRPGAAERLARRRRAMAGPVGCGLCGIDSIGEALRPAAEVTTDALRLRACDLRGAAQALRRRQPLHDATHAVHAAGLWRPGRGLVLAREDVGRHNALDKLVGAAARGGETGAGAAVVLTSRVSVEMVQKAAALGAEAILAVSAPTALAARMAEAAGLTLVAGLKAGPGPAATHPHRLEGA
jgi:FdhD protein